jgi:hypothetical protein
MHEEGDPADDIYESSVRHDSILVVPDHLTKAISIQEKSG